MPKLCDTHIGEHHTDYYVSQRAMMADLRRQGKTLSLEHM